MGQKKLLRFNQLKSFSNVFEYPKNISGTWHTVFENKNPVILELACGRGEYAVGLGAMYPKQNYIGIDVKGNRMYLGAKKALDLSLKNVRFLRTQIEMLPEYFSTNEVDEIWITFPDPQLRTSRAKKRLTHPRFLRLYQQVLKKSGIIHLKTDSPVLYDFTLRVINMYGLKLMKSSDDVFSAENIDERLKIKTHYEGLDIAQSSKIFYLQFSLPDTLINRDDELQEILKQTEQSTQ